MGKPERMFSAVFGCFLTGIGAYALLLGEAPAIWAIGGGAVLVLFGGNMLYAAYCGRPSWISRLGPLP